MIWGVDLGGTKIEGVVLESATDMRALSRLRLDTQADKGYKHIALRIKELIGLLTAETGVVPKIVGLGHPGVEDPATGLIKNSNTQSLNGMPFRADLERLLGIPVRMANDANCFTLAESIFGAGKGHTTVFGVILGTGVGGGIVINGDVVVGAQGIAGEWGHNVLSESGEKCYCGKFGCVETIISGPALERFYAAQTNSKQTLRHIVAQASDDEAAAATIARLTQYFGKAIAAVINILDPHCIVLGGGVSNVDALYTDGVTEAAKSVVNTRLDTKIYKHKLGDSAGVFGAALLTANSAM